MFTFEDKIEAINESINKHRNRWRLTILKFMDFDDVSQLLLIHIAKKWHLWDQNKPLERWLSRLISNQIKNMMRNYYTNIARPCVSCVHNLGDDHCAQTQSGDQCSECPFYKKWAERKKDGYHVRFPLELEYHSQEANNRIDTTIDYELVLPRVLGFIKGKLAEKDFEAFVLFFIDKMDDNKAAEKLGIRKSRSSGKCSAKEIESLKQRLFSEVSLLIRSDEACDLTHG